MATGRPVTREVLAMVPGSGHVQTHISPGSHDALEAIKVLLMPDELPTAYQRRYRDALHEIRPHVGWLGDADDLVSAPSMRVVLDPAFWIRDGECG